MARPRFFRVPKDIAIQAIKKHKGYFKGICDDLKIPRITLYDWIYKDEDIKKCMNEMRIKYSYGVWS
jgi:hypothetical protein